MGFERVRDDLLGFRLGSTEQALTTFAGVGTVSRHILDQTTIIHEDKSGVVCAWVGASPDANGPSILDIARAVIDGDPSELARLRASFAVFVHDPSTRNSWLVSDRYGHCPVYYTDSGETLAFCTKFLPLFRAGLAEWRWNPVALIDLVTFEHVTGDETLSKGVRLLPAATVLRFRDGRRELSSYWRPEFEPGSEKTRAVVDRLYHALVESTRERVGDADSVAVTLSGGLDSRALLNCANELGSRVRTFTFGLPGCRDDVIARRLADKLHVPHTFVSADGSHLDRWLDHAVYVTGGMVGAIHFHIMTLTETLMEAGETVVLDGLGGDALTGGHLKPQMVLTRSPDRAVELLFRQRATGWRNAADILHPDVLAGLDYDPRDAIRRHMPGHGQAPAWHGCHYFDLLERQRRFIQYGPQLFDSFLAVRTPFYGNCFYDACLRFTPWQLAEQRAYLLMHRNHMRGLACVPDALRNIPLTRPPSVRFGKKVVDALFRRLPGAIRQVVDAGDVPTTNYAGWLRGLLAGDLGRGLLSDLARVGPLLREDEMKRVVASHQCSVADWSGKLGVALALGACARNTRAEGI